MKNKITAMLFDLDGVIVDTAKYHYLAWKKLADSLGIYFDEVINERLKGVSRMASLDIILEKSTVQYSDKEKEELATRKNNWYTEMITTLTPEDTLPGVVDFLKNLKENKYSTAICSASKSAAYIIEKLQLVEYFDEIVGGNDVTRPKPDPEVFEIAAKRLGAEPWQCIVYEDAYAGVDAAKKAGMHTLGLGNPQILTNADLVFPDIKGIPFGIEELVSTYSKEVAK